MHILFTLFLISKMLGPPHIPFYPYENRMSLQGVTDHAEAQKDFDRALLLLHNFEYPDARDLFKDAQKKDPMFGAAYWGEAMTFNHPVWRIQDIESAREVIAKVTDLKQQNKNIHLSALDADLLKSLDILYGDGKKQERDKRYSDFMGLLHARFKGNHDITAFYALSLLGISENWNAELGNQAAALSAGILKENPKHPGALHYYIHAQDHPEYAQNAWQQANDYAKVASYSGHALHMPSHIYLALGLWDDVVRSNEISWQAGVDRKEAKNLNNNALNYHGHWWLEYGYLQQGKFARAEEVLENQLTLTRELPSAQARNHFVIMRGHYLLETNDWSSQTALEDVEVKDLRVEIRSLHYFLNGLMAFRKNDKEGLSKIIQQIKSAINQSKQLKLAEEGITLCKPGSGLPGQAGISQASILQEELTGLLTFLNKDNVQAKKHFQNAIALEEANGYFYGPPEIAKPTHEFYGEFLVAINEPEAALRSFEKALQKAPGRNQSLRGLMEIANKTGDTMKAKMASDQLSKNLTNADSQVAASFFH